MKPRIFHLPFLVLVMRHAYSLRAQSPGFVHVANGEGILSDLKVKRLDEKDSLDLTCEKAKADIYRRAVTSFNRWDEFRLPSNKRKISLGPNDGWIILAPCNGLCNVGSTQNQWALMDTVYFVLTNNGDLKEQLGDAQDNK